MNSISSHIKSRISRAKAGSIFIPSDFKDLAPSSAIRKTLSRLEKENVIYRISHGIYMKPKRHKLFGNIFPNSDELAAALAKKHGMKIIPSSQYALNMLGLSSQVVMRTNYVTNGSRRVIKLGKGELVFSPTSHRKIGMKGKYSSLLFLALEDLNLNQLSESQIKQIGKLLKKENKSDLNHDIKLASTRVSDYVLNNFINKREDEVVA